MKLKGFTLAEVIITLTIIGVVAAITMPVINVQTEESKFISQLHKAENSLNTAIKLAALDNDNLPVKHWKTFADATDETGRIDAFKNALMAQMNIINNCSNINECLYSGKYNNLKKTEVEDTNWKPATATCFITSDGITYCIKTAGDNGNGEILVDLNGPQKPNIFGVDSFNFNINGLNKSINAQNELTLCDINSSSNEAIKNGLGCTKWALRKGNMDYRRKTVSW